MKNLRGRFPVPVDMSRPRGERLIEANSARLQRRVRLFDHLSFAQWLRLEADPKALRFCERPVRLGPQCDAHVIDFWLDNAKANLADDVRHALAEFIGCFVDAGPAHLPDDRPYIERFFGSIAASLSSRLPGYTGSSARDVRRALMDPKGDLRLNVSVDEIEDLLEAAIGTYNGSPHNGLNGRTPLEAVTLSVRRPGAMLNWLPEAKRRTLCLMQTPRRATVRGYLQQGQRPHINFFGIRHTNTLLASSATYLGHPLRIYYNSHDLRTVRAFGSDGLEIGILKAQGALGGRSSTT